MPFFCASCPASAGFFGQAKKESPRGSARKNPGAKRRNKELRVAHKKELEIIEKGKGVHRAPFDRLRVTTVSSAEKGVMEASFGRLRVTTTGSAEKGVMEATTASSG